MGTKKAGAETPAGGESLAVARGGIRAAPGAIAAADMGEAAIYEQADR